MNFGAENQSLVLFKRPTDITITGRVNRAKFSLQSCGTRLGRNTDLEMWRIKTLSPVGGPERLQASKKF